MKLAAAKTDVGSVDTTTKGAGRTGPDKQGSDGTAPPFEDLLADLKGEPKTGASTSGVAAGPSGVSVSAPASIAARVPASNVSTISKGVLGGDDSTRAEPSVAGGVERDRVSGAVTTPASATGQPSQGIETSKDGATIIDAFFSMLGKDAGNGRNATSSTSSQGDDNRVATLLKRLASKGDATDASPPTAGTAASAVPDAFSALLVGQALSAAPVSASLSLPAALSPTLAADAVKNAVGAMASSALDRSARAPTKETRVSDTSAEAVVTDVSISSHLAPFSVSRLAGNEGKPPGPAEAKVGSGDAAMPERPTAQDGQQTAPLSIGREDPLPVLAAQSTLVGSIPAPVNAIAKAIGALASQPATADVPSDKPSVAVARTMTLQMSPASLGTVAIKMHMTGQTLDVQLSISDPQTLGMVTRERDSLAAALHDKQYDLNSLVIQDAGATIPLGGNNASQGDTTGSRAAQDQRGDDPSGRRSSGREEQGADQSPRRERQGQDTGARGPGDARRDSLFV